MARPKPRSTVPKPSLYTSPQTLQSPGTRALGTRVQMSPVSAPSLGRGPPRTLGRDSWWGWHPGQLWASARPWSQLAENKGTSEGGWQGGPPNGVPQHSPTLTPLVGWEPGGRCFRGLWPNRSLLGTGSNNNKTAAWHLGFRRPTTTPVLPAAKPKPPEDAKAGGLCPTALAGDN